MTKNNDSQTNPQSLAERVKRLRELNSYRPKFSGTFDIELRQYWNADARDAFEIAVQRIRKYPEAMQTINDLVNLVGEINIRLVQIASGDYRACGLFAEDVAKDALAKSAPIAALAKEPKQ